MLNKRPQPCAWKEHGVGRQFLKNKLCQARTFRLDECRLIKNIDNNGPPRRLSLCQPVNVVPILDPNTRKQATLLGEQVVRDHMTRAFFSTVYCHHSLDNLNKAPSARLPMKWIVYGQVLVNVAIT